MSRHPFFFFLFLVLQTETSLAQIVAQRLSAAFAQFTGDAQLQQSMASLYVIDAASGKVELDRNSNIGLAPASTQKVITSTASYEILGNNYRYTTKFGY